MRFSYGIVVILSLVCSPCAAREVAAPDVAHVALPDGLWDYTKLDEDGNRVLAAFRNGKSGWVVAVGLDGKTVIPYFSKQDSGTHVAVAVPDKNRLIVTRDDSKVAVIDATTGATLKLIEVGSPSDAGLYDPVSGHVYLTADGATEEDGRILVIDPVTATLVKRIELTKLEVEAPTIAKGGTLYVGAYSRGAVVAIDTRTGRRGRSITLPACVHPKGMAADDARHLLYAACTDGRFVVVNLADGKSLASVAIPTGLDGLVYDPARQRAYTVVVNEVVAVGVADPRHPHIVSTFKIPKSSMGGAFDQRSGLYYIPMASFTGLKMDKGIMIDGGQQILGSVEMAIYDMRKLK